MPNQPPPHAPRPRPAHTHQLVRPPAQRRPLTPRTPAAARQILFYQNDYGRQVRDVLSGATDFGVMQSGWIEANLPEALPLLRFLNASSPAYQAEPYPFGLTTHLIPTYGIAAAPDVPWRLRELIAQALVGLNRSDPAARAAGVSKFTMPGDYALVARVLEHVGILYRDDQADARCEET
jgi:hypothetical protein